MSLGKEFKLKFHYDDSGKYFSLNLSNESNILWSVDLSKEEFERFISDGIRMIKEVNLMDIKEYEERKSRERERDERILSLENRP